MPYLLKLYLRTPSKALKDESVYFENSTSLYPVFSKSITDCFNNFSIFKGRTIPFKLGQAK